MTESLDESDATESEAPAIPLTQPGISALFGDYAVRSPGVEIVLEGRTVSAPAGD